MHTETGSLSLSQKCLRKLADISKQIWNSCCSLCRNVCSGAAAAVVVVVSPFLNLLLLLRRRRRLVGFCNRRRRRRRRRRCPSIHQDLDGGEGLLETQFGRRRLDREGILSNGKSLRCTRFYIQGDPINGPPTA